MTVDDDILLVFLALFTAIDLVGFWIIAREDREGFWESILPIAVNIGAVVVSWAVVIASMMEKGAIFRFNI